MMVLMLDGKWRKLMGLVLSDGDRVCIVGGGPAGSFAALHLLKFMEECNLNLEVLIFEPRDFTQIGPGGCNRCAGILSSRLISALDSLNLYLPEDVIQSKVEAYALNLDGESIQLEQPDPMRKILSIYRGSGPRITKGNEVGSFDQYLLDQACRQGAKHIQARVRKVTWEGRPFVHTTSATFKADLLILATGVNSRPPLDEEFGYSPPKTAIMAQDEILRPSTWPENQVSAYFRRPPGMIFGALTPKGNYLNISLLGQDMTTDAISDFIEAQDLKDSLGKIPTSLCGCTPRIAIRPARKYFGDRWVAVGDAAVTRLYKDGIGSAFFTSYEAIKTAFHSGISRSDFKRYYAKFCSKIAQDNSYGRVLFRLWSITLNVPYLLRLWRNIIRDEQEGSPEGRLYVRFLWGMFTGDESYRNLFWLMFSPTSYKKVWSGLRNQIRNGNDA
jgi:flavin-dependent dehydrogenase